MQHVPQSCPSPGYGAGVFIYTSTPIKGKSRAAKSRGHFQLARESPRVGKYPCWQSEIRLWGLSDKGEGRSWQGGGAEGTGVSRQLP